MVDTVIPEVTYDAYTWLQLIGLGGLAGALGQGARTIVGLKKLSDASSGNKLGDLIVASRLFTSLAIGAVAGTAAAIGIFTNIAHISAQQIFGVAAAGYAGSDFIEGFIKRTVGTTSVEAGTEAIGTGQSTGGAAIAAPSTGADDGVG